jgi:choline dehydrogenase
MQRCLTSSVLTYNRYHRGPSSDYDRWAKLTEDSSWSYDSLLPLFKKSEGFEPPTVQSDYVPDKISDKYHGFTGEWKVSYNAYFHKISSYFIRAAQVMGLNFNPDFNAESTLGAGRIQTFVGPDCARSNTEKAFLSEDVRARPSLSVITSAQCLRVIVEDGRCTGAVVLYQGEEIHIRAKREVIISCGAFDSPRILDASGIPLPGIGKNLQDHLGINISFKIPHSFDKSIHTIDQWNGAFNKLVVLYKYLVHKTGPAASNLGEAVAFYRTELQHILQDDASSGPDAPHIELIAVPGLTHHHEGQQTPAEIRTRPDFDWSRFEWHGRYITIVPLLMNPYSRGQLTFKEGRMDIDPNYLDDKRDLEVMVEAVKFVRRIVKEGYPKEGVEGIEEALPGEHVRSDEGIAAYIRSHSETYYHPVGTCKVVAILLNAEFRWDWPLIRWQWYLPNSRCTVYKT